MRRISILTLAVMLGAAAAAVTAIQSDAAQAQLEAARKVEVIEGDLPGAIKRYQVVVDQYKASDRAAAAQALLRMAGCYQKQGNARAQAIYERVLAEFADQPEAVAAAREHLGSRPASGLTTERLRKSKGGRISPDGRYEIVENAFDEGNNVAIRDLSTGKVRRLTSDGVTGWPEALPLSAAFSPDGKSVVYGWVPASDANYQGIVRVVGTGREAAASERTLYENPDILDLSPTDWSPDGRWIAVLIRRKDHTAQIGVLNAADGALRVLKTVDWSGVGGLRFSPDSTTLAYHRPASDGVFQRDVFTIAVDGSRETRIADSPGDDSLLEWMPDGRRVLIASDRGGSMSIWTVPAHGPASTSSYELVKPDVGIISSLGLTRDGTLYYNLLPSRANIYTAQFDTASGQLSSPPVRPIRQFKGYNSSPEWSSDGRFLAFASRRDIPAPINVSPTVVPILSVETGQVVREMMPAIFYGGIGRWSPDGGLFIARGADLKGRSGIIKIDATTGETTLVVPDETCSGIPHWAPGGQSFFCYHFGDQDRGIVQVDVASGAVLRTFPVPGQGWAVSPDGQYLLYAVNDALGLIDLATGHTREILKLTPADQFGNAMSVDWVPDSGAVVFYGTLHGDQGMWYVPIDGRQPHKIDVDLGPIYCWRFNATTGQVAFSTDGIMAHLEMWKMEHFLPPADAAAQ